MRIIFIKYQECAFPWFSRASFHHAMEAGQSRAPLELSGKLAPGRLRRNQMPLLQGDDAINFFTGGDPGLPVSPLALLALQFMPMGCAKCGVGLLAVHSDSQALSAAFASRFFEQNIAAVLQAQAAGDDKLPSMQRSLKTMLIETLVLFVGRQGRALSCTPQVGDVLRLRAAEGTAAERVTGIVLGVRVRRDGVWTHAHLAVNGQVSWVSKSTVAAHLGRMKGITRVDAPPPAHARERVQAGGRGAQLSRRSSIQVVA